MVIIAAIGADNPEKNEVSPQLVACAALITDTTAQGLHMGDLHHAVKANLMRESDVRAELAEVITLRRPGRAHDGEIVMFDSTGTAIQDVVSALVVFERARTNAIGLAVNLLKE